MTCDSCTATYPERHDTDCPALHQAQAAIDTEKKAARMRTIADRLLDLIVVATFAAVLAYPNGPLPTWLNLVIGAVLGAYIVVRMAVARRSVRA